MRDVGPCLAPDLPFHGARAASTPADVPVTLAAFADAVVHDVQRHAGPDAPVVLIGHSLGGAVCVEAARRLGTRTAQIIALDSLLNPRVYPRQAPWLVATSRAVSRLLHPLMARLLARALLPAPRDPALLENVVAGLLALPARVAADASADLAAWDRDAALQDVAAPVTLIPAAPFFRRDAYTTVASRCALVGPAAGSHFFLREQPEHTAALLRACLSAPAASHKT
jgi:thioesterase domain-containing protein